MKFKRVRKIHFVCGVFTQKVESIIKHDELLDSNLHHKVPISTPNITRFARQWVATVHREGGCVGVGQTRP